jgi:hypothetical protein
MLGKVDKEIDVTTGDIMVYVWDGSAWIPQKANTTGEIIIGGSLVKEDYDYISAAYPDSTTETYTFKNGGSGGTTVATVTVVYTDATKENLSSVTKT